MITEMKHGPDTVNTVDENVLDRRGEVKVSLYYMDKAILEERHYLLQKWQLNAMEE